MAVDHTPERAPGVQFPPSAHFTRLCGFSVNYSMAWFVYIVKCKDSSFYTGITWNLKKRIQDHNAGKYLNFTKSRLPVRLAYWERYSNRIEAAKREKEIKGWRRQKKVTLINSLHLGTK